MYALNCFHERPIIGTSNRILSSGFFPVIVVSGGNGKPGLSVIRSDGTECDVDLGEVPQVRWLLWLPAFAQAVLPLTKLA